MIERIDFDFSMPYILWDIKLIFSFLTVTVYFLLRSVVTVEEKTNSMTSNNSNSLFLSVETRGELQDREEKNDNP